jgi:hypothetical protein
MTIISPSRSRAPLHIAILEADRPMPGTTAKYGGYGGVFTSLLHLASSSSPPHPPPQISVFDIVADPPPSPPNNVEDYFDAVLITGSKADAFGDEDWIVRLVDYVREAVEGGKTKVLGVCFGHQIIARAMGVRVERGTGWEASVTPVPLTKHGKKWFGKDVLVNPPPPRRASHTPRGC